MKGYETRHPGMIKGHVFPIRVGGQKRERHGPSAGTCTVNVSTLLVSG